MIWYVGYLNCEFLGYISNNVRNSFLNFWTCISDKLEFQTEELTQFISISLKKL